MGVDLGVGHVHPVVQAFDPGNVDADVAAEVEVEAAVVLLAADLGLPQRVDGGGVDAFDIVAEGLAVRQVRFHVRGLVDIGAGGDVVVHGVGVCHVGTDLDVLRNMGAEVHRGVVADEVVAHHDTLLVGVAEGDVIVGVLRTAGEAEVVVLRVARAGDHVIPVGRAAFVVVGLLEEGHPRGVGQVLDAAAGVAVLDVVFRGEEALAVGGPGELVGSREGDHRLAFLALLEGDHDHAVHAVRGLGTVGGQGGRVLEDAD